MGYSVSTSASQEKVVGGKTAWAVSLAVSSDDPAFPAKCLVFQAENPSDPNSRCWFTCVANPAQLLEYPEDAPAEISDGLYQPYFRLDSVELVGRNPTDIENLIAQFIEEVTLLARNIVAIDSLSEPTVTEIVT